MKFTVIGLDGWEYGPFTLEEINRSIASGQFSQNCLVKESDGGRWRKACEIAGVAGSGIPVPLPLGGIGYPGAFMQDLDISELTLEQVGPFVLRHAPTYAAAASVGGPMWGIKGGNTTVTITVPGNPLCVMLYKEFEYPLAQAAAFPINGRGWIRIPPPLLARILKASKPLPEEAQDCLDRFYGRLSDQLFLEGDACGLVKFTNGAGLRFDMRQERNLLGTVLYKLSFLSRGSFSPSEYDPEGDCPWPDDTAYETVHHGAARPDGWRAFLLLKRPIRDTRGY